MRGARLVAALALLAATARMLAAADALPGMPALPELIKQLHSMDMRERHQATGWLYLMSDADLAAVEQDFKDKGGIQDLGDLLEEMPIAHGWPQAVQAKAKVLVNQRSTYDSLKDLGADELRPLAKAIALLLGEVPTDRMYQGDWLGIAQRCPEPLLMQQAARYLIAHADVRMNGAFPAALLAPLAAQWPRLSAQDKLRLVRSVRVDRAAPLPAELIAIAGDPAPELRAEAMAAMTGSSDPAALHIVEQGLQDEDNRVQVAALNLATSIRPAPLPLLKRLAADERIPGACRAQAWSAIDASSGWSADAAEAVLVRAGTPAEVSLTLTAGLANHGEHEWLLDHLETLPQACRTEALGALGGSFTPKVHAALDHYLMSANPSSAAYVISSVGQAKSSEAMDWLIGLLRDRHPEIQQAAASTLECATGLQGPSLSMEEPAAPGRSQERERRSQAEQADAAAQRRFAVWRAWWVRYESPLTPADQARMDAARSAAAELAAHPGEGDAGESSPFADLPLQLALRACCAHSDLGTDSLLWLAQRHDPDLAAQVESLFDDPQLSQHADAVATALMRMPAQPSLVPQLLARLKQPCGFACVRVLLAWKPSEAASRVARAVLADGVGGDSEVEALRQWAPPELGDLVRSLALDHGADAPGRYRALHLFMEIAGPADMQSLAGLVERDEAAASDAAPLIARLLIEGQPSIQAALMPAIEGGKAQARVLDAVCDVLCDLSERDGQDHEVPRRILGGMRAILAAPGSKVKARADALAILACSGDLGGLALARQALAPLTVEDLDACCDRLAAAGTAAARPYVELAISIPRISDRAFFELERWLGGTGHASSAEIERVRAVREQRAPQPATAINAAPQGLIQVEAQIPSVIVTGSGNLAIPVTITNRGRKPLQVMSQCSAILANPSGGGPLGMLTLTIAKNLSASGTPSGAVPPGASMKGTAVFKIDGGLNAQSPWSMVRLELDWHFDPIPPQKPAGAWRQVLFLTPELAKFLRSGH